MRKAFLASIGVAVVILAVIVLLKVAPTSVGRARGGDAQASGTAWGEPNLQGLWTYDYEVPLQRPARYANREFFTDEERAELDKLRSGAISRESDESRRKRGSEQDVGGAYNAEIYTTHKHMGRRTSLVVDPPDGKIPPLTPEAQKKRAALREFQLALLQATNVCKNNLAGCAGGKYGPPSPRRA